MTRTYSTPLGYCFGFSYLAVSVTVSGSSTYTKVAFAKLYDRKTPITAADLLNDRVLAARVRKVWRAPQRAALQHDHGLADPGRMPILYANDT